MDSETITSLIASVWERQDKTNRLLVAIAQRLDRNERSLRRLVQQQLRVMQGPLADLEHFGDDVSYEEVMEAQRAAQQAQQAQQPRAFEGRFRQGRDGDGSFYFRYELPGERWLRVHTNADYEVLDVYLESPDGSREFLSPEDALRRFGRLPIWGMSAERSASGDDPTAQSNNPDVEVQHG